MSAIINGNRLFLNGYVYIHSKYDGSRQQWECRRLRLKECKARAVTNRPEPGAPVIVFRGTEKSPHEHPPNFNECEAEKVKISLKKKSVDQPERPPSQLLRTELAGLSQGKQFHFEGWLEYI